MMKIISSLLSCLYLLSISAMADKRVTDLEDPALLEAYLDGLIKSSMDKHHSPSGVISIYKDGQFLLSKGYGSQSLGDGQQSAKPVQAESSLFRPGSISKLFTWVAVMQQVESGKLDLDNDVNLYLKRFQVKDSWPGQPVTLRHLMTHTAGFEDGALGYLILDKPELVLPLPEALEKYQPERINPPGLHTAYSNWGTALAGLIVANVSGETFENYVQKRIFNVLGMQYASFIEPLPPTLENHAVQAYQWSAGRYKAKPYERISGFAPAGSAAMSANDVMKFGIALLQNGQYQNQQILQASTLQQMLEQGFSHDERTRGMGMGFIKRRFGNETLELFGHEGASAYFFSHLGISQKENLVVFASFSGAGGRSVYKDFLQNFYTRFFSEHSGTPKTIKTTAQDLQEYRGDYLPWRGSFSKAEALLRVLNGKSVQVVHSDQSAALLYSGKRYHMVDKDLFREAHGFGRIAFQRNQKSQVSDMIVDGRAYTQYYKAPLFESKTFTLIVLMVIPLFALALLIHLLYKSTHYANHTGQKALFYSQIVWAVSTLAFFILMTLSLLSLPTIVNGIPASLTIALCFPLLSALASLALLAILVKYRQAPFGIKTKLLAYSTLTISLFSLYFYQYWNLLGFKYFSV
ncbi:serine hydrolase domain-containing protein [Pseudoteredinibacter isoporae]|uniref:CubicO group peptidase (Beta-lactamase class C family) n=1 Tax=Pseudoteredinibacter isoporae TaxID=570281 RepID=A0A7X0JS79_9GAMM|nr:serine hydrolase domain-containing protein [Pseudoteredinibacter isoporae]MBB6521337.1 CubicO group peptidase (beta-lactamase class C family) [Pseudoteredinibacter isoporae]NHO86892.1 serine hydrolase [Pseudoteredinibacter isoporae]NIB24656.1 serine hydrolase [Pseudoteredinibacter isoporae]